jgi:hypothetical protein
MTAQVSEDLAAKIASAVAEAVTIALKGTAKAEPSPADRVAARPIGDFQRQGSAAMAAQLDAAQAAQAGLRGMPPTAESVRRRLAVAETTAPPAAAPAQPPQLAPANQATRAAITEAARLALPMILKACGLPGRRAGETATSAVAAESAPDELWERRNQIWAGAMVSPHPAEAPAAAASASPPAEDVWENRAAIFDLTIPPSFGARPFSSATVPGTPWVHGN